MLRRITLLAPAPTRAQRQGRFPHADDETEAVSETDATAMLAALGVLGAVVGGPERRVTETAAALGLTVAVCADLAAWSSGQWAGRTIDDVANEDPRAFEAWRTEPEVGAPGGGSCFSLIDRVATWLDGGTAEGSTTVIADGTVIRAVAVHVLDAEPRSFWRMDVEPLSMTRVQNDGTTWRLRSFGARVRVRQDAPRSGRDSS